MNKSSNFAGIVGKKKPKGKKPMALPMMGPLRGMKPPAKKGKRK